MTVERYGMLRFAQHDNRGVITGHAERSKAESKHLRFPMPNLQWITVEDLAPILTQVRCVAKMRTFKLWAGGDAHVGTDLARANRRSLADAILQAEQGGAEGGPPFEWDIMLDIGDLSGSQTPPDDEEGEEVVRQYSASTIHPREDFYNIVGNHDASGPDEPCQWWFRKWVDPTGDNSEYSGVHADRRPYPIEGTWERYSFQVGNVLLRPQQVRTDCSGDG